MTLAINLTHAELDCGHLAGLDLSSDIPLLNVLPQSGGFKNKQLCIQHVSTAVLNERAERSPPAIRLSSVGVGDFLVVDQQTVLVAPAIAVPEKTLIGFLFGPVFSVIAYMRGALPLHASAVLTPRGVVAFVGNSGEGKSTIAAAFHSLGFEVVADDVLNIALKDEYQFRAWPGIRWLRLSGASAAALGYAYDPAIDLCTPKRKHHLALPAMQAIYSPLPICAIYVLDNASSQGQENILPVRGSKAALTLLANIYRPNLAQRVGCWAAVSAECIEMASSVPIYTFRRYKSLTRLRTNVDKLCQHLQTI